ncbi:hypothetical protein COS77_02945 [Candidatus Roizmanbacteria bacterium CG06_land_8_20_14_3_00_34_14]|uniref:DUF5678 domain-containing protein n=3 Tax=Candidatus Roizmaniibacteriota TaxID=1752723 RepID=A0A2H0KK53_9BACT|nr:MAG: hypothetical protein COV87_02290 [Candidatus Roizmanbacteria bacterium CG11_big_fil_rev_8_21_14_0_20_37_16]PIU36797.1 MAG: hypothetical protein COT02_04105 [Candidatus Roizmanbacteria bacterium CG07_land_8_20_14_0_80_34_15]PIU74168.1 MAG: hypothetical protein COS77_02945 [Candidatus Roizmanbacteria bacterium CG06_land_8_20_14_3_00_34_14]
MSTINLTQEFIVEKGREIYHKIKPHLDKKYKPGYYVTIEANSGKFFVGKTPIEAMDKAKKNFPRRVFYMANIGRLPSMFK